MPHSHLHALAAATALVAIPENPAPGAEHSAGTGRALVHSVAEVNDPLSHGVVGDALLSINEAIQLHNRTLLPAQLSFAEQMQLSGAGSDIAWINIDASSVPTITVERDFDVVQDWPHGFLLQGYNGDAEIDFSGAGIQHGFRATSNFASWRNLVLRGGPRGIELQQTDASFGGTVLDHVTFTGQTIAGFVGTGTSTNGYGRVLFTRCTFANLPVAATWDESAPGRTSVFVVADTQVTGTTTGIDVLLGSAGAAVLQFERTSVESTGAAVALRRTTGGDRAVTASLVHLRTRGGNGLSIAGSATGTTVLDAHALDLDATGSALALGSPGAGVSGIVDDALARGAVGVHASSNGTLDANNLLLANGPVLLSSTGATLRLRRSRFVATAIATTGTTAIAVEDGTLESGSVQGSPSASLTLARCHSNVAVGAHVVVSSPLASPALGGLEVTPFAATAGGLLQFTSTMPPGYFGLHVVGFTSPTPLFLADELHVYLDLSTAVTLPGIAFGQQTSSFAIPNDPAFWDTDWVAQTAVLAPTGALGPAVHATAPQRFVIRP